MHFYRLILIHILYSKKITYFEPLFALTFHNLYQECCGCCAQGHKAGTEGKDCRRPPKSYLRNCRNQYAKCCFMVSDRLFHFNGDLYVLISIDRDIFYILLTYPYYDCDLFWYTSSSRLTYLVNIFIHPLSSTPFSSPIFFIIQYSLLTLLTQLSLLLTQPSSPNSTLYLINPPNSTLLP